MLASSASDDSAAAPPSFSFDLGEPKVKAAAQSDREVRCLPSLRTHIGLSQIADLEIATRSLLAIKATLEMEGKRGRAR